MRIPAGTSLLACLFLASSLASCAVDDEPTPEDEGGDVDGDQVEDGALDEEFPSEGDDDAPVSLAGWEVQGRSLHLGEHTYGTVDVGERDAWPVWASGSVMRPVRLRFRVTGYDGAKVRVAVLGPLVDGARATLASAGYGSPTSNASVDVSVKTTGQLLVVVGSHDLASYAGYDAHLACNPSADADQCNPWRVDALSVPKLGGLTGTTTSGGEQLIGGYINGGLSAQSSYEVELWRSRPGLHFTATHLATSESSGSQVNWIFPAGTIKEGDDLLMKVLPGPRLTYADFGAWARFAPNGHAFARLDAIDYGDLGGLTIFGVASYFEGRDLFVLQDANSGVEIDHESAVATLPGQSTNGLGSFAISIGEPFDKDGELLPNLPHDGDVLELVRVNLSETTESLGCFEYCNDLAGEGDCTAQIVACP